VYNYDAVGNLLSITRASSTGGGTIGIFVFVPSSGLVGAPVQLRGFGFDPVPGNNQVRFNGTLASVTAATATTLNVVIPTGATTGPIAITNTNGTATSANPFTVLVPPVITGVEPPRVPQGGATGVIITGINLTGTTAIQFTQAGLTATIQSGVTATRLPVQLNVGAAVPVGQYAFTAVSSAGNAQSGTVNIEVTTAIPSVTVGKPLSVIKPFPAQVAPGGPSAAVSPPLSVAMP